MSLKREWPLLASIATAAAFFVFRSQLLGDIDNAWWAAFAFAWLYGIILWSAFAALRHAQCLAMLLGEPIGTLILTLSAIAIEVLMISAAMRTGAPVSPLARDLVYAVIMIVCNGGVGLALLLGGLRYHEQTCDLQAANAYLAVLAPLAVLGLVLPNFTEASEVGLSTPHQVLLVLVCVALFAVFLAVQTQRHRQYFLPAGEVIDAHAGLEPRSGLYHALFLVAFILPIVLLSKQIAVPIEYGAQELGAPAGLVGFAVAVLVLAPASLVALRAARADQLQRSINLLLGSALVSIGLTIPAALAIGLFTERVVALGLSAIDTLMLVLTLALSMLTFASGRSNVLLGAVHLILFGVYLLLIFAG